MIQKIWNDTFTVKTYEANLFQELDLISLLNRLQDAASRHAETLGFGWDNMQEKQNFWVLSRFLVRIKSIPTWKSRLTLETWPKTADALAAYRDFLVCDEAGNIMVEATSMWLVLDAETHRPVKMSNVLSNLDHTTDKSAIEEKPKKIVVPENKTLLHEVEIVYSDLDMNLHANNVSYVRKVLDSYPLDFLSKHRPVQIEINFLKEALFGQKLYAYLHNDIEDDNHFLSLQDENNKQFLTVHLIWKTQQ
jgi:acyl-ACP thioesterase